MLGPVCIKRSVRPHSYTLTSKKSLASLTSDRERYYYITPAVWMIGKTDKRRVDLPGAASQQEDCPIHTTPIDLDNAPMYSGFIHAPASRKVRWGFAFPDLLVE
jgi:hypothetical protein